jgi:hypothetical protein
VVREEVEHYRTARLVALRTAVLRAAADDDLDTVIAYHSRTLEAQACTASLPDVAARLHRDDRKRHPEPVWADWLSGEHPTDHRRDVLTRFVERAGTDGTIARRAVLGNVRVLAEGVDLRADTVAFMDPKFSIVEIVQAIGRALRRHPGEGRTATIIVPVFLAPGGRPDDMLVSDSYHPLVRTLHALAARPGHARHPRPQRTQTLGEGGDRHRGHRPPSRRRRRAHRGPGRRRRAR